jgi:hypothetical protein
MGLANYFDRLFSSGNIFSKRETIIDNLIIGNYYHDFGGDYCDNCFFKINNSEKRYLIRIHFVEDGYFFRQCRDSYAQDFNICFRCAPHRERAACIIDSGIRQIINKNKKKKPEEEQMSIIEVLNNEKVKLEKQLGELNNVKLPENLPKHITEHLTMKKSLIDNYIKSIDELKNNYQLDETIKKLFTV